MQQIILASSSIYRRKIFENLQLKFETFSPDIDETPLSRESAEQMVARLSHAKAKAAQKIYPNAICIGADSTACLDHIIYGKPKDEQDAFLQLSAFSNQTVTFYTSISILSNAAMSTYEKTHQIQVEFKNLIEKTIKNYIRKDNPLYSCGSIKAEGLGLALIKRISSDDPTALIGLPIIDLCTELERLGIEVI